MGRSTIDAAIDRYIDAARRAGAPEPDGAALESDLDAIRSAIAPLTLGHDVVAMWRRLQAPPAMPYPSWLAARDALRFWQEDSGGSSGSHPLFPIAYESHGFLSAGLVGDPEESVIWQWAYDAQPATLRFRTLAVAFDAAADALDAGIFVWRPERSPGSAADGERDVERLQATIQSAVLRGDMVAAQAAVLRLAGFAGPEVVDAIAVTIRRSEGLPVAERGG